MDSVLMGMWGAFAFFVLSLHKWFRGLSMDKLIFCMVYYITRDVFIGLPQGRAMIA